MQNFCLRSSPNFSVFLIIFSPPAPITLSVDKTKKIKQSFIRTK